ncbi:K(+)/H(+) antiporter NhaP (plasmid) [Roseovarius sp. THAF9]|uniref:cation:proton antiporter n=1 Tax=Roseovarius sp. THAF9 TaxID=2587847 RepID=UPI001267A734|nr:cation:proton antiporter [Roseovarius sp. THAF9]QFT95474.1 K(+)/H(+) antiporter NhaP [Roseovarius sp. THAF9]
MIDSYTVTPSTYVALATVGVAFLVYGGLGRLLNRLSFSSAMFFLLVGVAASTVGLGTISAEAAGLLLRIYAEVTLAIVLCTESARMDFRALRRDLGTPVRLIAIALPASIVLGGIAAWLMLPGIGWVEAALLAVVLAPTDADLARPVATNPDVPEEVALGIEVESGLNDGICVPLLLTLGALAVGAQSDEAAAPMLLRFLSDELGIGTGVGAAVGFAFIWFANTTKGRFFVVGSWLLVPFVALAISSFALAQSLGGSGFIAAFVSGVVVSFDNQKRRFKLIETSEGLANVVSALTWIAFGVFCIPIVWASATWSMAVLSILFLTAVRMGPVMVALIASGLPASQRAFVGWFGPRGLASIAFLMLLLDEGVITTDGPIFEVTVLTIAASIVLHGISAGPLAAMIGRPSDTGESSIENQKRNTDQ